MRRKPVSSSADLPYSPPPKPMDPARKAELKTLLLQAEFETVALIRSHSTPLSPVETEVDKEFDRMFVISHQVCLERIRQAYSRLLVDEIYGNCKTCGEPIAIEDLRAAWFLPACHTCRGKQAEEERTQTAIKAAQRALHEALPVLGPQS